MNALPRPFGFLCASLLIGCFALAGARAATNVTYTATFDPNSNPDAVDQLSNPVDVWTCSFTGNSTQTGSYFSSGSWALYSISADAVATHTLDGGALNSGQMIGITFLNQGVATGQEVGINLLSGATVEFSLYFLGGGIGDYQYTDGTVTGQDSGEGYAYNQSIPFGFALTGSASYAATFGTSSWTGTLASNSVDGISVFDSAENPGDNGNVLFGGLTVAPVPEPGAPALLGAAACAAVVLRSVRRRASGGR